MIGRFIKPMLAKPVSEHPEAPESGDFIAEPKLDGVRLQLHVQNRRAVAAFSRTGRSVFCDAGMAWLREVVWPQRRMIVDAEAYASDGGNLAAPSVMSARASATGDVRIAVFDLLVLGSEDVMAASWEARRSLLESAFDGWEHERIRLVPVSDDPKALWMEWVEQLGGEGVMLKARDSIYVPGWRSPAWLKWKVEYTVDVVITGVTTKATWNRGGYRSGEAALTYGYWDPATRAFVTVGQGVKVGRADDIRQHVGKVAEMRCAGVMRSGALRHHHLIRFRDDKDATDCVLLTEMAA
jgi:DNA ligase-1